MIPGRKYFKDQEIYGDWFPRMGDILFVRAEAIDKKTGSSMDLLIEVYSKKLRDVGKGTQVTSSPGGSAIDWQLEVDSATAGVQEFIGIPDSTGGMSELIRYRISTSGGSTDDWVHMRIFPPVFLDAAQ